MSSREELNQLYRDPTKPRGDDQLVQDLCNWKWKRQIWCATLAGQN